MAQNKSLKVANKIKNAFATNEKGNTAKATDRKRTELNKLELLITVVNRSKAEFYIDLIQSFEVNVQLSVRAHGTANEHILKLLGVEETPKTVIFSIIKEDKVQEALSTLETKFNSIKDGKGIAYTVPMSSIIGVAIYGFLSNNTKTVKGDKNEKL